MPDDGDDTIPAGMERFTAEEAARYKSLLTVWNSLSDADALMQEIEQRAQFFAVSQGDLKFWREMFVAMSCGYLTHAIRIRLGDDPPDFLLEYPTHVQAFELVQIVPAGYRISGEYRTYAENLNRTGSTPIRTMTYERGKAEYDAVVDDLEDGISAKCGKYDDKTMILVADVAHEVYFDTDTSAVHNMARVARKGLKHFREIWVRKSNNILRVSHYSASMIKAPWPSDD